VNASDHIGHGKSVNNDAELSHFPRKDDWQRSVEILNVLTNKIRTEHPGVPVFVLGHSMGSVMVQTYMMQHGSEAGGFILSGAIRQPAFMAGIGKFIADSLSVLFGPGDRSKLIIFLGYGQYNRKFKPNRTASDWLCSENSIVDEYIKSPLCGIPLTNRFYHNFFHGFKYIAKHGNLEKIPDGTPVYIIAGASDPAGFNGKAPLKIKDLLIKYAKANVEIKLYPGYRHEILNEVNKEAVYRDVLEWIKKKIN
jgi:alpha-beta hydrolase superfamily lysophospholipase